MNTKKRTLLSFVALLSLIVTISGVVLFFNFTDSGNPLDSPDRRILGSWTTSIQLSELGPCLNFITFKEDGSYKWTVCLLYIWFSDCGKYKISADKLTFSSSISDDGSDDEYPFLFQKNKLIITEGTYQYHFRKIPKLQ